MPDLVLHTRPGCHLCERAQAILRGLPEQYGLSLRTESIDSNPALESRYGERIPVLTLNDEEILAWPFTRAEAHQALAERASG